MLPLPLLQDAWEAHSAKLRLILRCSGDLADEATQEAFLALARQDELPPATLPWLVRVAKNYVKQQYRSQQRSKDRHLQYAMLRTVSSGDEQTDLADEVTVALRALASADAEIIAMHLWAEMNFETIGELLGCSRSTAHRQYQAALEQLRSSLSEQNESTKQDRNHA